MISWLPFHFVAALFAWGLRETIRGAGAENTAISSAPDSTVESGDSENPGDPEDAEADTPTTTTAVTETDTDTYKQ